MRFITVARQINTNSLKQQGIIGFQKDTYRFIDQASFTKGVATFDGATTALITKCSTLTAFIKYYCSFSRGSNRTQCCREGVQFVREGT